MALSIKDRIAPAFGRHETFTIRYGWLKRGFDEAMVDPMVFYAGDVHHRLGVGKNMAKSIRFWLTATRLMGEVPSANSSRRTAMRPTEFGAALLASDPTVDRQPYDERLAELDLCRRAPIGLDPYLEDLGSWWALHWMMLAPGGYLPVWWSAFHTFTGVTFSTEVLLEHALAQIDATSAWSTPRPPSASTVKKDVLALVRAYGGTAGSRRADKADDVIDAPMVPLGLVSESDEGFRFNLGPKSGLSPEIAAYACLDFMAATGTTARTALVPTLAAEVGAPGRAFKLSAKELADLLSQAAQAHSDIVELASTSGSDTLAVIGGQPLSQVAAQMLMRHYASRGEVTDLTTATLSVTPRLV